MKPDFAGWSCPAPLRDYPEIVMAHGGGGKLTQELVENLFLPAFGGGSGKDLGDAAVVETGGGRIALSTDSFVVRPLIFPGSSIGELAVNGTVNDLAMQGARPLYLTAGFILEEGLPMGLLGEIVQRMGQAARRAGVRIVAGDTKVVERGAADQMFINTAGVGVLPAGVELGPGRIEPGDVILLSGTIGDHGLAIMSLREGLEFEAPIESDCQPLHELAALLLGRSGAVKMMRDATRGGVAAVLNEMAQAAGLGFELEEERIPVRPVVAAACEMLGLDPLYVANEGKFVAIVAAEAAAELLAELRRMPGGEDAVVAGKVEHAHRGVVRVRTAFGTRRVVPMPLGEQLPRIC